MKLKLSSFLQKKTNVFIYKTLGWKITLFYITLLGKLYFLLNRKEKKKIKNSVENVLSDKKSRAEIKPVVQNVFKGILFHYYEKIFNAYSSAETLTAFFNTHMENGSKSVIEKALSKGKGVLLVTGHFGGVEFLPGYLGANNYPVSIVVRFSSSQLRDISIEKGAQFNSKIIDADKTTNVIKEVFKNLKENRIVITQCDEIDEWRPDDQETISFLGKRTNLDRTINVLAKRGSAEVVFGVMNRDEKNHYQFTASSSEQVRERLRCEPTVSAGELALKYMEEYIYKNPENWYLWKKYPEINAILPDVKEADAPMATPMLTPALGKV